MNDSVQRIINLLAERGIKQSFVEGMLGAYRGKITEWKKGKSTPTNKELRIIADFFDVSTDYLLGNTEQTSMEHRRESEGTQLIARLDGDLPPAEAQEFFKIIDENFERFMAAKRVQNPNGNDVQT